MHSTKTLVIAVVVVGALMFLVGHVLWNGDDVDNSEVTTPTPTVSASPVASAPVRSPIAHTVRLSATGPVPATLVIRTGDTVSLVGDDTGGFWPKSGTCAGFDAMRALAPGERYTLTFTERRTCTYYDNRQPAASARQGTIIVQ